MICSVVKDDFSQLMKHRQQLRVINAYWGDNSPLFGEGINSLSIWVNHTLDW